MKVVEPSSPPEVPKFGVRKASETYVPRPGAYALIFDPKGRLAVLESSQGYFLPGGGLEGNETPEETLVREVREECGFNVTIIGRVGEAVEYRRTAGHELGIRKECVFFAANVGETYGVAREDDHVLIWLELHEAEIRLGHGSQKWAVHQVYKHSE